MPTPLGNLSPFCSKHPNGTEEACGACGTARRRYDNAVADLELAASVAASAALIARERCTDCNPAGWLEDDEGNLGGRCEHPNLKPSVPSLGETA